MELFQKKVCIKCSCGNIILSFDTAFSLLLEYMKTDMVYFATEGFMDYCIDIINKFMELGKNATDIINIDYIDENIENEENEINNEIYYSIIKSLKQRINFISENVFI